MIYYNAVYQFICHHQSLLITNKIFTFNITLHGSFHASALDFQHFFVNKRSNAEFNELENPQRNIVSNKSFETSHETFIKHVTH